MANEEQLSILRQGVEVWNKWREENPEKGINLSNIYLSESNLDGINLERANLSGSKFNETLLHHANLTKADLTEADLSGAALIEAELSEAKLVLANLHLAGLEMSNLTKTILWGAILWGTSLFRANLTECMLGRANLCVASLNEAKLPGAVFGETMLADLDLSKTYGLDNVQHIQASNITMSTIQRSKGKIPIEFLRGCGLSDLDIEYAKLANPSLDSEEVTNISYKIHQLYFDRGIQYYSCFISYSNKDQEFAQRLHNDLQNNGVRCWFAPEDLKIGDQIRPRIDQEIRLRDKLLVILSENSIRSEWVGDEVEAALEEESKNNRLVLFPIRLDDTVMSTRDDWAAKIKRRRHIGDFSNWRDKASYQKAFERLLRDLKATGGEVNGE